MKLLTDLLKIWSGSGKEHNMKNYIYNYLKDEDVSIVTDYIGNMYITKGYAKHYACVAAHLDQVQAPYPCDFDVKLDNNIIKGYIESTNASYGIGADDKCGIWIALTLLKEVKALKVVFFVQEELGACGSEQCNLDFFNDVMYVIQADRMGNSDVVYKIYDVPLCSLEFGLDINKAMKKYGYKFTSGYLTDVVMLVLADVGVSCINVSCGYYNHHTNKEYINIQDLKNAYKFIKTIYYTLTKVYPHYANPSIYTSTRVVS